MLPFRAVKETTAGGARPGGACPIALPPLLACVLALPLVAACDQAPSADALPEWKPSDHHSVDDNGGAQASGAQAPAAARGAPGAGDTAQLVEITWRQQCSQCHGAMGRGDGPNGPMLHTRDLTDPEWQAKMSDADIAATIRTGKDKMPKFDLPDPVMQGLVARIRQLKGG
jgi:cytochrome c oxidase cbb3-type subunit 3